MIIEALDIRNGSDADLAAYRDLLATTTAEATPDDEHMPLAEALGWFRLGPEARKTWAWLAWDDDRAQVLGGCLLMFWDEEANRNLASFWLDVQPEARRQGIGRALLAQLVDVAREQGRTLLDASTSSNVPAGSAFLEWLGARHAFTGRKNALDLTDVDRDLLEEWVANAKDRASDYRLEAWDAPCPEDKVEAFVAAQAIMNTAPREEFDAEDDVFTVELLREREASNALRATEEWVIAAIHEPTGAIAGYTDIYLPSTTWPTRGFQGDTGVDPAHRDKGLGRWLKAAMLLRVIDERPAVRRIVTFNAGSNEPMLNINHALGFHCVDERPTYQIDLETLAAKVTQ